MKCCPFFVSFNILNLFSDRMAEIVKKELNVKESEIISTVEEACFVNILEDDIKLENAEKQGKPSSF